MVSRYKVIISNRNIYKEIDLLPEASQVKVGTETDFDFRLRKDLFFEKIELCFINDGDSWSVSCSDNLYLDAGDIRKMLTKKLVHGDTFEVKYQESNNDVFSVDFVIDFENGQRKYERAIDISLLPIIRIGTDSSNHIVINSPFVRNDSIELQRINNGYILKTFHSSYDVNINGSKGKENAVIKNGDFFSISDFVFFIKDGIIWTEIRDGLFVNGLAIYDYPTPNQYPRFNRNTRLKMVLNKDEIEILDPPSKPQKPKSNLFMTLLPSLGMLLTSGIMATKGGGMVAFSIISGAMAIVTSVLGVIQGNRDFKREAAERIEKYNKYADTKRAEISSYRDIERESLSKIYIDQNTEQVMLQNFSSDLFDRLPDDEDFLSVRLGVGSVKSIRKINYKKQEKLEVEDDLQLIPEQISDEFEILDNAPVICDFKKSNSIGIIGSEIARFSIFKNIVIDICARQYYSDVKLFFVAKEEHADRVNWLRFLPYVDNNVTGSRNIVCDDDSKNRAFDYLYKELTQREQGEKGEHLVVFFYDEYGFQSHPLSKFISKASELSVTFVFMADSKDLVPIGCNYIISMESLSKGYLLDTSNQDETTEFVFDAASDDLAHQIIDLLAPVYTEEISLEGTLTKSISMFEMMNILTVDDINLSENWKASEVYKSMAAPLGVSKSGMVYLDLHDKAHGPHGLVAGTTGSGKSEVLQTYILSIATLFHPYEVGFVIIDFKGGGMVNQFKDLPHLLGAITNIDGKEIDRSLKSIKAELQKRQRLFAEAEVNHIDKYIKKFKAGEVETPLPHLVLIVDEFAELKAEQPEFMKELISAARIGRSLGVHLILATQKPSGQVDDQIWSNSRFKLCLKVQSQEDSNEVLKSPLAAEIKEPGRAYLQVGNNEVFELFQSAYSGAPEKMEDGSIKEFKIFEVSNSGRRTPVFIQKKKKSSGNNNTQLEAIVSHVAKYCENNLIKRLPNICLPPLPEVINYSDESCKNDALISVGLYDDPDNQVQNSAYMDIDSKNTIIIGSSQYGKTNMLQSFIRTIAESTSPKESTMYILDFGSMVLKNFETLNHVGGVVTSSEDEKLKNLFKLLFAEISTRKEKLISVGVSSFSSYLEAGYKDMPHIYIFIDNITALMELYLEDDDSLLTVIREGVSVGISTIIANSQTSGIGYKYLSNFANKICLYCNDSNEYRNLFDHIHLQPDEVPGRCILEIDKRILECQSYLAFNGDREIERVQEMQKFVSETNSKYKNQKAKQIPCIPKVLDNETMQSIYDEKPNGYALPIGLTYEEVTPFVLDLSCLGIIGITGRSGFGHKNLVSLILNNLLSGNMNKAEIVIFDDVTRKFSEYKDLVAYYSLNVSSVTDVIVEWHKELQRRYEDMLLNDSSDTSDRLLLMIVQNNDVATAIQSDMNISDKFNEILTNYKDMGVCFVFSNYPNSSISYDAPDALRMIKQRQRVVCLDDLQNLKCFDPPYEAIRQYRKPVSIGDGYYIEENEVTKLKLILSE